VNLEQALQWNVRTCRPDDKRETQGGSPSESESSKAGHRDGVARSSDEASVMEVERRGYPVQLDLWQQLEIRRKATKKAKQFEITKQEVFNAWKRVKANRGAPGVDKESLEVFGTNLKDNLYKLWNRMSSGSYFPQAVRRVEIPKKDGSTRPLGIPTVYDRVAQEVVRARLEVRLESHFHEDSYGYRPGKSAIDAIRTCRERNWKYDWVLDVDIQEFFDTIDHELLLKAVRKHCSEKWTLLYIERWLKAPIQHKDGREEASNTGTPQGGVISPLLANLYLHYAFDKWIEREYPAVKFERYADDVVIHCRSVNEANALKSALGERLKECRLTLHPEKTGIVYCKDGYRGKNYPKVSYRFLGYTFKPRKAQIRRTGKRYTSFLPAVSKEAQKHFLHQLHDKKLRQWLNAKIERVAEHINPLIRGWFRYFSQFYRSALWFAYGCIDQQLIKWARRKYRWGKWRAINWLNRLKKQQPNLFAHWTILDS